MSEEDKYPWQQRNRERKAKQVASKPRKVIKPIKVKPYKLRKRTRKGNAADRIYSVLRKDFLLDHPVCEAGCPGCKGVATEVHHKRGRGVWQNVVEYFLAVCHHCHSWIETHPAEAKAKGFSLPRIGKIG